MTQYKWGHLTQEDILKMLMDIYNEFGFLTYNHYKKLVSERGLPSMNVILKKFNTTWLNIVSMLGINDNTNHSTKSGYIRYTDEFALNKLKEFVNQVNRIPTSEDFRKNKWHPTYLWYTKHFGGMFEACLKAKLCSEEDRETYLQRYKGKKKNIAFGKDKNERIQITISELKRIANFLRRCPTAKEYNKYNNGGYTSSSFKKVFKMTYNEVLCKYFPDYRIKKKTFPKSMSNENIKQYLANELIKISNKIGRTPKQTELSKLGLYGLGTYLKYFDKSSYNEILQEIGLELNKRNKIEKTNDELLKDFYNVFHKLGHIPIGKEYTDNGIEGKWVYMNRFGSIENVCKLLNINYEEYYKPTSAGIICLDNNGNLCKSLIERDISNFFIVNNIAFEKEYPYNKIIKGDKRKFDWKINIDGKNFYVEYAGMYRINTRGQIDNKYTKRFNNKINTLIKHGYINQCIFIYPEDIKNKSLKQIFENYFDMEFLDINYSEYNKTVKYKNLSDRELLELFSVFYNANNTTKSKDLINYNYSLYGEIVRRYGNYYTFLTKNNFKAVKPKNYWTEEKVFEVFKYMLSKYNRIISHTQKNIIATDHHCRDVVSIASKYKWIDIKLKFFNYCIDNAIIIPQYELNWLYKVATNTGTGIKGRISKEQQALAIHIINSYVNKCA